MLCLNCQRLMPPGATQCPYCLAFLPPAPFSAYQTAKVTPQQKTKRGMCGMVLLVLVFVLGASTGSFYLGRSSTTWGKQALPATYIDFLNQKVDQQLAQKLLLQVEPPCVCYLDNYGRVLPIPGAHLAIDKYIYIHFSALPPTHTGYIMAAWYRMDPISLLFTETQSAFDEPFATYTANYIQQPGKHFVNLYYCEQLDCSDARLVYVVSFFVNTA